MKYHATAVVKVIEAFTTSMRIESVMEYKNIHYKIIFISHR